MVVKTESAFRFYVMEAVGLGGFVLVAGLCVIFLEHPALAVMQSPLALHPFLRRLLLGIVIGIYVWATTVLWSKKSGAHFNPAVTWTLYRLGRIRLPHAVAYTVAQFIGAIAAALLLKATVGEWFGHPAIHYGQTAPKPQFSSLTAFAAEFIISFLLMVTVLIASTSKRWAPRLPVLLGILLCLFIIFELPFSGMSMNPARSTAGDVAAGDFEHLWLYFVAPMAAMFFASLLFQRLQKTQNPADKKELPEHPSSSAQ